MPFKKLKISLLVCVMLMRFAVSAMAEEQASEMVDISFLAGFTYYPAYSVVTENKTLTVSGTAEPYSVARVKVNGQEADSEEDWSRWSREVDLSVGDNLITIEVETVSGEIITVTNTVRYHGVVGHSSEGLTFDGENYLYYEDYIRDQIIEHDLATGVQSVVGPDEIAGLPSGFIGEHAVAQGPYIYLQGRAEPFSGGLFYKVHRPSKTAALLADTYLPNTDVELRAPRSFVIDSAGDTLFVLDGSRAAIIKIDTITGTKTLVTHTDKYADDAAFSYGNNLCLDESKERLYIAGSDLNRDWGFFHIDLTGPQAGRYQQLPYPTGQACMPFEEIRSSWGLEIDETGTHLFMGVDSKLVQWDLENNCLSVVSEHDPLALGVDYSLQGIAYNATRNEMYLGFFSTLAKYCFDDATFSVVERRGFSDHPFFISEPDFFAVDHPQGMIYSAFDDFLSAHDASTGMTTQTLILDEEVYGLTLDPATDRLYVSIDDNSLLGYIDTAATDFNFVALTSNDTNGGLDLDTFQGLTVADDGFLYALNDGAVFRIDPKTGVLFNLSPSNLNGLEFDRERFMVYDPLNRRLFVQDYVYENNSIRITSVDIETGARTVLFDNDDRDNDPDNNIRFLYGLGLDAPNQILYFSFRSDIYTLDLTTNTLALAVERSYGDSDLGGISDLQLTDNGILYLADNYANGYWYINLATNERVIIQ